MTDAKQKPREWTIYKRGGIDCVNGPDTDSSMGGGQVSVIEHSAFDALERENAELKAAESCQRTLACNLTIERDALKAENERLRKEMKIDQANVDRMQALCNAREDEIGSLRAENAKLAREENALRGAYSGVLYERDELRAEQIAHLQLIGSQAETIDALRAKVAEACCEKSD